MVYWGLDIRDLNFVDQMYMFCWVNKNIKPVVLWVTGSVNSSILLFRSQFKGAWFYLRQQNSSPTNTFYYTWHLKTDSDLSFALLCRLPFTQKRSHRIPVYSIRTSEINPYSLFADNLARTVYLVLTAEATVHVSRKCRSVLPEPLITSYSIWQEAGRGSRQRCREVMKKHW